MSARRTLNIDGGLHAELSQECKNRSKKGQKLKIQVLGDILLTRGLRQLQEGRFDIEVGQVEILESEEAKA